MSEIRFTIHGQPCSKSNSSQLVTIGKRTSIGKSKEAKAYIRGALPQIPAAARQRLEGPVAVTLRMFYTWEGPDLDESQVLDVLQDQWSKAKEVNGAKLPKRLLQAGVYRNDRQVREKHVFHAIDKRNPRCEIVVVPLVAQQAEIRLADADDPFAVTAA